MSPEQPASKQCPRCGTEFVPGSSPLGLCPACLLKLGASDPSVILRTDQVELPADPAERGPAAPSATVASPPRRSWRVPLIAAAVFVALLALLLFMRRPAPASLVFDSPVRFDLELPDGVEAIDGPHFAVSPDGRRVVLAAREPGGDSRLWLRVLQSIEWRALAGTDGARFPFWSPDSRHVGFFASRSLKRIDVESAFVQPLCDALPGGGAAWGRQDTIVFAAGATGPLFRVPSSGGAPQPLTTLDRAHGETSHAWPSFLPDGEQVLFVSSATDSTTGEPAGSLAVLSLRSGRHKTIVTPADSGAFAQGHLIVARGPLLLAMPFDPSRADVRGDARPVGGRAHPPFSVSEGGVLMHGTSAQVPSRLTWMDRTGRMLGDLAEPGDYERVSMSPDGRRVAAVRRDGPQQHPRLWMLERERQVAMPLTTGQGVDGAPVWSPDGRQIVFASRRGRSRDLLLIAVDGGKSETIHTSSEPMEPTSWSPDGRVLLYQTESEGTGTDIWMLTLPDRKAVPVLQTPANESDARLSPDGRWIAYTSDESGRPEVYVRPFPSGDTRWQASSSGGRRPRWRADGRELYFAESGRLMVADVVAGPALQFGAPHMLLPMPFGDEYDVAPDGQRFVMTVPIRSQEREKLRIVLNWASELKP